MHSYFIIAFLSLLLFGCVTKDSVPTSLDIAFNVSKEVVDLGNNKKKIILRGNGMMNDAGAVEAFSKRADEVWGEAPYDYGFNIEEVKREVASLFGDSLKSLPNDFYLVMAPHYGQYAGLAAGLSVFSNQYSDKSVGELIGLDKELKIEGTIVLRDKIILNRDININIIIPDDFSFKNKQYKGSGARLAESSKHVFGKYFDRVKISKEPEQRGVNIFINVIRWQDRHPMSGHRDIITAEYCFFRQNSITPFIQFLVIAEESFLSATFSKENIWSIVPINPKPEEYIDEPLSRRIEQFIAFKKTN